MVETHLDSNFLRTSAVRFMYLVRKTHLFDADDLPKTVYRYPTLSGHVLRLVETGLFAERNERVNDLGYAEFRIMPHRGHVLL